MRRFFDDYGLYLAWLISIAATAGSLYLSEVRFFVPCVLCWYQRIFMYPFVITLGIASFRGDKKILPYALPISLFGTIIAGYHVLEQNIPGFGVPALCKVGVPCSSKYFNYWGFVSIPVLSLIAYLLISILLILVATSKKPSKY